MEFSEVRSQHRATEIYRDSRQGEHELIRLFIARKELLALLAGVDRSSPSGQLEIVVVVLQTLNSRYSGLRVFYTEQAGRLNGSRPLAELRRVVDKYKVREDVRSALGFGQDTSRHELAPMQHL